MKTPKPILERRRWLRLHDALPFKIGHASYEAEVVTVNLSPHGALFISDKDIPMMTKLDIALTLPASKGARALTLKLKGVVVRKDPHPDQNGRFHIAVYFSEISPKEEASLQAYIENRLKQ